MSKFKTLLLAHHAADNHATRVAVEQFGANVARRTDGKVTIATVPNSRLGDPPTLLRMVVDGETDMALPPYDRLGPYAHRFGCVSMPFLFDDHAHADRVLDGEFAAWAQPELESMGLTYLGRWEWGFRQITNSRHPILGPGDMQGLRIRVPPIMPYPAVIRAFGGTPVIVEYSKLVRAFRQGLIDGQENPVAVIESLDLNGVQNYLTILDYSYSSMAHVVNARALMRLEPEQQDILRDESRRAALLMRQLVRSYEADRLDSFVGRGGRIDRPDPAPFKALIAPVYDMIGQLLGDEVVTDCLKIVDRHRIRRQLTEGSSL